MDTYVYAMDTCVLQVFESIFIFIFLNKTCLDECRTCVGKCPTSVNVRHKHAAFLEVSVLLRTPTSVNLFSVNSIASYPMGWICSASHSLRHNVHKITTQCDQSYDPITLCHNSNDSVSGKSHLQYDVVFGHNCNGCASLEGCKLHTDHYQC